MLARSEEYLSQTERTLLQNVLQSYADVFAKNEFDLGSFTAIEHSIDTGDSRPIKQRLRRTPACFADEEEKHLNKLLGADVIEPSVCVRMGLSTCIGKEKRWNALLVCRLPSIKHRN